MNEIHSFFVVVTASKEQGYSKNSSDLLSRLHPKKFKYMHGNALTNSNCARLL